MATYIKFGENEVDYDQLMQNAANEVYNFVKRQPWSNKRKESFMRAYSDIASRGITSAGIGENGLWNINYNGEDLSAESEMDKQMQGAAADFFINQMRSLPTKASLEEDATKKKEDLPIFNNSYFTQQFHGKIGTDWFGGLDWKQSEWNDFDKRGENGLRGTTERARRLANTLENYSASLKEGEHNFEGSPFTDLNEFKTRVNNVVSVLRNGTPDQYKDALYSIGLRYDDYFNDGSGDVYTTDEQGNPITYGAYYDAQAKLAEDEKKRKLAQEQAALNDKRGVIYPIQGIHAVEARNNPEGYHQWLGQTYGTGPSAYNKINNRIQQLINAGQSLSQADKKELGNLLYYIRQNNPGYQESGVSDEEYAELMKHNSLRGKKQENFIRFPWKTQNGLDVYGDNEGNLYYVKNDRQHSNGVIANPRLSFNRDAVNKYKQNFLNGTTRDSYLNTAGEWTSSDTAEASAIVADIASIIDTEPWSAAILGLSGAGLRNYALSQQPEISGSDIGWQVWDYVSSVIGAIPLLGDIAKGSNTVKAITKWLPRLGRLAATYDIYSNAPGSKEAIEKLTKEGYSSLTPNDWKALGGLFRGLAAHGRMNASNVQSKKVLQSRGISIENPISGKKWRQYLTEGWTQPKINTQQSVKVKVKKANGEEEVKEIKGISNEEAANLEKEFISAGNNKETKLKVLKENVNFKEQAKKQGIKVDDITEVVTNNSWRNMASSKHTWLRVPKIFGTTGNTFTPHTIRTGEDTFNELLKKSNWWNKLGLERYDKFYRAQYGEPYSPTSSVESPTLNSKKKWADIEVGESKWKRSDDAKLYRDVLSGNFGKEKIKSGKYKIGDVEFNVELNTGQTSSGILQYPGNSGMSFFRFKNQKELQKKVAEILKEQRVKTTSSGKVKVDVKKMGEVIRDFKSKGLLKQGGTINNNKIKQYKNFINK